MGNVTAAEERGSGVRGSDTLSKEDSESTSISLESVDQREPSGELVRRAWCLFW